jgi:hypothetical protein
MLHSVTGSRVGVREEPVKKTTRGRGRTVIREQVRGFARSDGHENNDRLGGDQCSAGSAAWNAAVASRS